MAQIVIKIEDAEFDNVKRWVCLNAPIPLDSDSQPTLSAEEHIQKLLVEHLKSRCRIGESIEKRQQQNNFKEDSIT